MWNNAALCPEFDAIPQDLHVVAYSSAMAAMKSSQQTEMMRPSGGQSPAPTHNAPDSTIPGTISMELAASSQTLLDHDQGTYSFIPPNI